MKEKKESRLRLRVEPTLKNLIPIKDRSEWIRESIRQRLENEHGLTSVYKENLAIFNREILAIGRNLNQLTRAANSGKEVYLNPVLTERLMSTLNSVKAEMTEVNLKLGDLGK